AIENERQVVGVTHRTVGQAEGFEEYSMARALAVEGKGLVAVTELQQAAGMLQPAQRGGRLRCLRSGQVLTVGRLQRIEGKIVLDVHEQQFLMLLFVLQAEL